MKISYVSPFSDKAAVAFRAQELHAMLKFHRLVFYKADVYGCSGGALDDDSTVYIDSARKQWLFLMHSYQIIKFVIESDIVIFLKTYPANIFAAAVLKIFFRKKIFFDLDEVDSITQLDLKSGLSSFVSFWFWRLSELLTKSISTGHLISNIRISSLLGLSNTFFLPNFVRYSSFNGLKFNPLVDLNIIYAGSFHNATEIIDCLKWIHNKRFSIILIGTGRELPLVEDFLRINNYKFTSDGHLDSNRLICRLNEVRGVFLAPYRKIERVRYSSSGKLPIYMSTGCPVIVSLVDGPLDFERSSNVFFKYKHPSEIVGLLSSIFDQNAFDHNRCQAQKLLVENHFNIEVQAPRLLSYLCER